MSNQSNKEKWEADLLQKYEQLNAQSIVKFLGIVDSYLDSNKSHQYYNFNRGIFDSVYKSNQLTFKQFRCLYTFVTNCSNKLQRINEKVKTF